MDRLDASLEITHIYNAYIYFIPVYAFKWYLRPIDYIKINGKFTNRYKLTNRHSRHAQHTTTCYHRWLFWMFITKRNTRTNIVTYVDHWSLWIFTFCPSKLYSNISIIVPEINDLFDSWLQNHLRAFVAWKKSDIHGTT